MEQCGTSFDQQGNLKNHMIIHTGGKSFICVQCGKCFRYKFTINNHMRVHSTENCIKCHKCGRDFRDKIQLKNHENKCTLGRGFSCAITVERLA